MRTGLRSGDGLLRAGDTLLGERDLYVRRAFLGLYLRRVALEEAENILQRGMKQKEPAGGRADSVWFFRQRYAPLGLL
jgi:hypothetical protein